MHSACRSGGKLVSWRNRAGRHRLTKSSGLHNFWGDSLAGKTGIFRGPAQQYSFASYLIRIRCANGMVSPTFLNFAMNAPMFRETEIVPHLKQQCGQANVNGTILRSMRIPVPPAAEQHRIVAKVDELMAICERLKADLGTARQRQATLAETLIESALEAA